jgi:hypothetical protein
VGRAGDFALGYAGLCLLSELLLLRRTARAVDGSRDQQPRLL